MLLPKYLSPYRIRKSCTSFGAPPTTTILGHRDRPTLVSLMPSLLVSLMSSLLVRMMASLLVTMTKSPVTLLMQMGLTVHHDCFPNLASININVSSHQHDHDAPKNIFKSNVK